jgi:arabinogalactan endo-1,4-beta-galactosidase
MNCNLNISLFLSALKNWCFLICLSIFLFNCNTESNKENEQIISPETEISFYKGADLSYVNEMEDCGAIYKDLSNLEKDPYQIFKEAGANLVRIRLWHNPDWTNYSNFEDVKRSIARAKEHRLEVLLDFHYSDTWADPEKQQIPAAWIEHVNNTNVLGDSLYNYTLNTLNVLAELNLTPDIVQVGNEINPMILQDGELQWPIDWQRNAYLINKGITAVRDFSAQQSQSVEVMLHIAQPENALWWFEQATANGVTNYDWIGLSYYPKWSTYNLNNVGEAFSTLINTYNKKLMVVETAYPFTLTDVDQAGNILGTDALIEGFPATQQGQLNYLAALSQAVFNAGGQGVVYWEPAWVSTGCSTLWGQGSHWDNATLFDQNNKVNLGMQFYNINLAD